MQSGNIAGVCTIPVNNTNYVQIQNAIGDGEVFGYFGYIIKE